MNLFQFAGKTVWGLLRLVADKVLPQLSMAENPLGEPNAGFLLWLGESPRLSAWAKNQIGYAAPIQASKTQSAVAVSNRNSNPNLTPSDNNLISNIRSGTNDFNGKKVLDGLSSAVGLQTIMTIGGTDQLWLARLIRTTWCLPRRQTGARIVLSTLMVVQLLFLLVPNELQAREVCGYDLTINPDYSDYPGCWYGGMGIGLSHVAPEGQTNNFFLDENEDSDSTIDFMVGHQFTPNWFVEFKYADLGTAGITNLDPVIAAAFPDAGITYRVPSLLAGYQWRKSKSFKPFVKLGLSIIANDSTGGPLPFAAQTSAQLAFGAGLKYDFKHSQWYLRSEIDWYDRDASYAGISIGRYFGKPPKKAIRVAQATQPDPTPSAAVASELPVLVYFGKDAHRLTLGTRRLLDKFSKLMKSRPNLSVEIAGFTDSHKSDLFNQRLSDKRATVVLIYLANQGVDTKRLITRGYGEFYPVADNATEEGRRANRRVELRQITP